MPYMNKVLAESECIYVCMCMCACMYVIGGNLHVSCDMRHRNWRFSKSRNQVVQVHMCYEYTPIGPEIIPNLATPCPPPADSCLPKLAMLHCLPFMHLSSLATSKDPNVTNLFIKCLRDNAYNNSVTHNITATERDE